MACVVFEAPTFSAKKLDCMAGVLNHAKSGGTSGVLWRRLGCPVSVWVLRPFVGKAWQEQCFKQGRQNFAVPCYGDHKPEVYQSPAYYIQGLYAVSGALR